MQVKLREHGFHADEDETRWWMVGSTTVSALTTFQVRPHASCACLVAQLLIYLPGMLAIATTVCCTVCLAEHTES